MALSDNNYLIIWPDSGLSTKNNHVNAPYHFIHLGEVVNYLNRNIGKKVDVLDIEASQIEFPVFMRQIICNNYTAVAIYLNSENLGNGLRLVEFIKTINPSCKIIAYGEMPLYLPKFFRTAMFDAIVDSDADQESAILDFFRYASSDDKSGLHDVFLVQNGMLISTRKGKKLDPSEWGFSQSDEVPIDKYISMEGKNQYVMTLSRGCPYGCKYCNATSYYGIHERRRDINSIIEFINANEYEYYKFFSPNFTLNRIESYRLCQAIIKNGKRIKWSCTTRPDLLDDEDLISAMADAGCVKVAVGIESISESDLNSIDKRYDRDAIADGINMLRKYGIEYKALVMFGVPNQTRENILYTIEFLKKMGLEIRPTAYTPFYEMNHYMTAEQISRYDKRTYYDGIDGLSYADLLRLIYDTESYQKVLGGEK